MSSLPTGTVTFFFTDIQGSTSMWERDARMMQAALARHDEIMRSTVEAHNGYVFKMVGDACCAAFSSAPDALRAAVAAQRAIFSEPWDERSRVRVRMALHTGEAEERDGDYFGPPSIAWRGSSRRATAARPSSRRPRGSGSRGTCRRGSPCGTWASGA